ncbi:MAG: hypothetical protein KAG80_05175 [Nocardioides sp.]|nr:hypothetical protein [Nocardioides sp.]
MPRRLRPLVGVHVALLAVGGVVLLLEPPTKGWAVLALLVSYAAGLMWTARHSGRRELVELAGFLLLVSVFQVLPDWVLAEVIGTLRFPDTGGARVDDTISLSMALMWVPPLFMALALAGLRPARSGLFAGVIFLGAEILAPVLELWEPVGDTTRMLGVAVYVLPPEVALGWAAAVAFTATRRRSWGVRVAAALAVSTFYLGALVLSYFVIDVAAWRVTW